MVGLAACRPPCGWRSLGDKRFEYEQTRHRPAIRIRDAEVGVWYSSLPCANGTRDGLKLSRQ